MFPDPVTLRTGLDVAAVIDRAATLRTSLYLTDGHTRAYTELLHKRSRCRQLLPPGPPVVITLR
jgi:hypothetical protein